MIDLALGFVIGGALGAIVHVIKTDSLRGRCRYWEALAQTYERSNVKLQDERRKRLEAEQAHADLADKHNILLAKAYIRDGARFVRVVK